MSDCSFVNVGVPLEINSSSSSSPRTVNPLHANRIIQWLKVTGVKENGCFYQMCLYRGKFWWRLSGMIYLEVRDYVHAAEALKGLCERVLEGEYLS